MVKVLISRGARFDPLNINNATPLMNACMYGQWDTADVLINFGQPTLQVNVYGENLLTLMSKAQPVSGKTSLKIFKFLLRKGFDLHQTDFYGFSAAHHILTHPSVAYLRDVLNTDISLLRTGEMQWPQLYSWNWYLYVAAELATITKRLRILRQYISTQDFQHLIYSNIEGKSSLLCLATYYGSIDAIRNLVKLGADLETECCEYGTPLMLASFRGQLDIVKYLVRSGAQVVYQSGGSFRSAIAIAHKSQQVLDWLLVGRYVDQRKLVYREQEQRGVSVVDWSGVCLAEVPSKWEWQQRRDETMLQYARRRQAIILELRGEVVRRTRLFQDESDMRREEK